MNKNPPSPGRIAAMVGFTLSVAALLMFLWVSFGGTLPLRPESYRFKADFPEAAGLVKEADVRMAGVNIGKVKDKELGPGGRSTRVTIELDHRFAPIGRDARAVLRQKSLLGETYVELTPGTPGDKKLADGGTLPDTSVDQSVQLDEVFRVFDPPTRRAFQEWLHEAGIATTGTFARDFNDSLGNAAPFFTGGADLLRPLAEQEVALRRVFRDTGRVFTAVSREDHNLQGLITGGDATFGALASRDEALAETFQIFPTFLREGRATTERLTRFANNTNPLIDQLRPAAREISPTLQGLDKLAPDLKGVFTNLEPLVRVSKKGLPATGQVLDNTRPLLARLDPWLRNLTPIIDYLGLYRREIVSFFANDAAATQATEGSFNDPSKFIHYLRTASPVNPEMMTGWPFRLSTNRSNPYTAPGGYDKLRTEGHLEVFGQYLCTGRPVPPPPAPNEFLSESVAAQIAQFIFGGDQNRGKAPPCDPQEPLGQAVGQSGLFPRLQPLP